MAAARKRTVTVRAADCIRGQFRAFKAKFPEIQQAIETFNASKRVIPPRRLPAEMRDHKLDGTLKGISECRLADDVLLLYEHKDDIVNMLYICTHAALYSKKVVSNVKDNRKALGGSKTRS